MNWIKIEDKLPKEGELVITWCPSVADIGYIFEGRWYKWRDSGNQDPIFWSDVTDWMPLPEKPNR